VHEPPGETAAQLDEERQLASGDGEPGARSGELLDRQ